MPSAGANIQFPEYPNIQPIVFFATRKYRNCGKISLGVLFCEAMQKVAAVQSLQDPDAKKLRMEARKAAKEARLVERRKEKEESQTCKAIERYERDRR